MPPRHDSARIGAIGQSARNAVTGSPRRDGGAAIQYRIAEVVDPLVHVVAKIDKKALAGLPQ